MRRWPMVKTAFAKWLLPSLVWLAIAAMFASAFATVGSAQELNRQGNLVDQGFFGVNVDKATSPEGMSGTLQVMLLLTVLSLAPAVLLMTTCFVRMIVVLGLLRQAIGTQQLPPSQVVTSISLFLTLLIMSPVWKQAYDEGIQPYTQKQIGLEQAWQRTVRPLRRFMAQQIE